MSPQNRVKMPIASDSRMLSKAWSLALSCIMVLPQSKSMDVIRLKPTASASLRRSLRSKYKILRPKITRMLILMTSIMISMMTSSTMTASVWVSRKKWALTFFWVTATCSAAIMKPKLNQSWSPARLSRTKGTKKKKTESFLDSELFQLLMSKQCSKGLGKMKHVTKTTHGTLLTKQINRHHWTAVTRSLTIQWSQEIWKSVIVRRCLALLIRKQMSQALTTFWSSWEKESCWARHRTSLRRKLTVWLTW